MDSMERFPICHLVAVPYPGRGHINPMLNICRLLASRKGLLITFVVTEEWLGFIGSEPKPPNLRLLSIPNVIPSERCRGADFVGFIEAVLTKMGDPVDRLIDGQDKPVSCILADTFLTWAVDIGQRRNIPVASLWPMSSSMIFICCHFDVIPSKLHLTADDWSERREERLDFIPGISSIRVADIPSPFSGWDENVLKLLKEAVSHVLKAQCLLVDSSYEVETQAVDALRVILPIPIYPVGPTIPYMTLQEASTNDTDYFTWLDSQPQGSVLYVSLGSFVPISSLQMDEILVGLRSSGVNFMWVARGETTRLQEAVTDSKIGILVPWCDQLKVLCHSSVGGFLTHCGWNSTMEGAFAGLPMHTFPLFADQFVNAKVIVEDWKVGIPLKKEVGEENIVKAEEITKAVQRVMDGDESKELRRKAKELQAICKRSIEKGGSSNASLDEFVKKCYSRPH